MITLDDSLLVAYLDGELDAKTVAEVEAALESDTEAQRRLSAMRSSGQLLRSAYNDVLHEAVPQKLVNTIEAARTRQTASPELVGRRTWWWPGLAASAAAVALVVGFLGGQSFQNPDQSLLESAGFELNQAHSDAIQVALEKNASNTTTRWTNADTGLSGAVTPIRTFRNRRGEFCREFRDIVDNGSTHTAFEVRCRTKQGVWQPAYRLITYSRSRN